MSNRSRKRVETNVYRGKKSKEISIMEGIEKAPTGIKGFDDVTFGGLPRGRPTLVAGAAGCGKTMFAMEFIVHGAVEYNEPGVFVTFEENVADLKKNFATLGYDLDKLIEDKKMVIDHVFLDRSLIMETGEYDLDALFIRLGYAIDSIGAKRISLDTIEVLFSGLSNHALLRSELVRLFRWLKDRGITTVVTGEKGDRTLTRYGLEEYIADCVIFLDSRVIEQIVTRRLRIVKYRGSIHGMDEYPFLINQDGIIIFPISSIKTDYKLSREHISTGIPKLDDMLDGKGFYRGSSVLVYGHGGHGQDELCRGVRGCGVPERREVPVHGYGGDGGPDHTEHAVDRSGSGAVGEEGPAEILYHPPGVVWPGNAHRTDRGHVEQVPAAERGHGPDLRLHRDRRRQRGQVDADQAAGLDESPGG